MNINRVIKSYFNLYFKGTKDVDSRTNLSLRKRFRILKRKNKALSKIFVSNAEIKHTNQKAKITLYIMNRQKLITKNKYFLFNKILTGYLLKKYYYKLYSKSITKIYNVYKNLNFIVRKKDYIKYKLHYLLKTIHLKNLELERIINIITYKYSEKYFKIMRNYEFEHSLNQYKFNQLIFLPRLSNILNNILNKKLEYNIINLKSFSYNADLFTKILGTLIRGKKRISLAEDMFHILDRVNLPKINTVTERMPKENNFDETLIKYNDPHLISNLNNDYDLNYIINDYNKFNNNKDKIHQTLFNSINYKNMGGMRIEISGRLTKRYRADRAIFKVRWKGGLKNIDSSYKGLSSVNYRGYAKPNLDYSILTSKRRIGAFAVKGWVSGKK